MPGLPVGLMYAEFQKPVEHGSAAIGETVRRYLVNRNQLVLDGA
jgi:hypothetical protein